MTMRVPANLALLALHQSGHHITPGTLRMWVHRGHITRGNGGYDLVEILTYLDHRTTTTTSTNTIQLDTRSEQV
jgi:hypothetical protein